jgi:hypothetical protein
VSPQLATALAVTLKPVNNIGLRDSGVVRMLLSPGANPNREGRMQNPQERAQANLSVVGSCSVTDCRFNEEHECHAGQIEVRVGPDGAHCGTYQPEASLRPRP